MHLSTKQFDFLLALAKASLLSGFRHAAPAYSSVRGSDPIFHSMMPGFVSLWQDDTLRGCMGRTDHALPLFHTIRTCAFEAAFRDPRFCGIGPAFLETGSIRLHVFPEIRGVLLHDYDAADEVIAATDSVRIEHGGKDATLLSYTQKDFRSKRLFVEAVMAKAKIPVTVPAHELRIGLYTTQDSALTPLTSIEDFTHDWTKPASHSRA